MRNATAVDIVRRLTGSLYRQTCEAPSVLGDGMGDAQHGITNALDEAIELGWVKVVSVKPTTYAGTCRFVALADGITYCPTCIAGCDHDQSGSCEHLGCWGPDATIDCEGVPFARVAVLTSAEWAEIDGTGVLTTA
uniref:hypothetical protein n=1 Tax=Paractinoplanes polyasparticus TaxID=2856853 RepID=UPI001C860F77|nr:hypothetical protein [Actinoplanes polyasparticus]